MEDYTSIGKTTRTYGIRGELRVFIRDPYLDDFLKTDVLFINQQGKQVPFFVEEIKMGNGILLKLEEVDTKEEAVPLCSKEIFLREQDLQTTPAPGDNDSDFEHLLGFIIVDTETGPLGPIEDILEVPQQILAVVQYRGRELLIPLHDDFLTDVDETERTLTMDLPEGLLEL